MERRCAFTLIELLVVIAIIALLLAILVPSLSLAKQKAASAVCLVNVKNLALGWYMYQEDNDGRIMSANDYAVEADGRFVGWIGVPEDINGNALSITQETPRVTDEDEIRGIEKGRLFEYVKSWKVYHCPADKLRKSIYDGTTVFVTYSIPECLYGITDPTSKSYNSQIIRYPEITSPARRYVFVESAETRNWNSSHHFVMAAPEYTGNPKWGWWGPMAVNHGDSSIMGFCDSHAEVRKWRDPFTKQRIDKLVNERVENYGQEYPPPDQQEDINYMAAGWPYRFKL